MKEKPDLDKIAREIEERYGISLTKIRSITFEPAYVFRAGKRKYTIELFQTNDSYEHPGEWVIGYSIDGVEWGTGSTVETVDDLFKALETDRDIVKDEHLCPGLKPVQGIQMRLF